MLLTSVSIVVLAASTFSFGNQQVGSVSNMTFGGLYVSNFTAPLNLGNITEIQVYMATGGTAAQAVIYSDIDGAPISLLAESEPVNLSGTDGSWVSFPVNYTGIPAFTYWIGVIFQGAATYYTQNANDSTVYSAPVAMNATLCPSGSASASNALTVYALYAPAPSGGQGTSWLETSLLWVAIVAAILAVVMAAAFTFTKKKVKQ